MLGAQETGRLDPAAKAAVLSVLVVDDDVETLAATATLIMTLGHRVTTASSGRDAVRAVRDLPIDLLLLDIGLPDIDGYEVVRRLTLLGERAMPVIALTGCGSERDVRRSTVAGFYDHIVKPCSAARLRHLLASVQARRAGRASEAVAAGLGTA